MYDNEIQTKNCNIIWTKVEIEHISQNLPSLFFLSAHKTLFTMLIVAGYRKYVTYMNLQ